MLKTALRDHAEAQSYVKRQCECGLSSKGGSSCPFWLEQVSAEPGSHQFSGHAVLGEALIRKNRMIFGSQKGELKQREMGWPMGLEPTTTGITILDSTN